MGKVVNVSMRQGKGDTLKENVGRLGKQSDQRMEYESLHYALRVCGGRPGVARRSLKGGRLSDQANTSNRGRARRPRLGGRCTTRGQSGVGLLSV